MNCGGNHHVILAIGHVTLISDDIMSLPVKTILVAEDEPLVRMLAAEVLTEAGFTVVETAHAGEAMAALHARSASVHLLFTDIHMPGLISGLDLAHQVQRLWPHIALLIVSGEFSPAEKDLPAGSRFLPKPYDLERVVGHIRELTAAV